MAFSIKSVEDAAEHGFHLVVDDAEKIFERVTSIGTEVVKSDSLEGALGEIENKLNRSPGASGSAISRSDGTPELRDDLVAAAAAAADTSELPTPAADAAAVSDAPTENTAPELAPGSAPVDTTGLTIDTPGETATGLVDAPSEPAAPAAPEGTVES